MRTNTGRPPFAHGQVLLDAGHFSGVRSADLYKGHIRLDTVIDGTYSKILTTDISAGHVKITSSAIFDGEWYDESGVEIDATTGINIYGTDAALTTRATKTGTIQCKVDASGNIVAGAGNVLLNAAGITLTGGYLKFKFGVFIQTIEATGNSELELTGCLDFDFAGAKLSRASEIDCAAAATRKIRNSDASGYIDLEDVVEITPKAADGGAVGTGALYFGEVNTKELILNAYTIATKPVAGVAGRVVFVSDEAAGQKFQGDTGAAWVYLG